jgi:hypothetical protein
LHRILLRSSATRSARSRPCRNSQQSALGAPEPGKNFG